MKKLLSVIRDTWTGSLILCLSLCLSLCLPLSVLAQDNLLDGTVPESIMPNSAISDSTDSSVGKASRIIALGGSVTEIIYALGQQARLVGIDQSSVYPPDTLSLPSIGYYRNVPAEGVLRLKPDLVIASEQAGPSQVIAQLASLGVRIERVSDQPEVESLYTRVVQIAKLLGVPEQGQVMRDELELQLATSYRFSSHQPSAMMIVMRTGKLLGAGRNTAAAKIIELSALENVLSDYTGYRPISAEVVSGRMPSALIVTSSTVKSFGGMDAVRQHVALNQTPAAINGHMIELDDLLAQGLGPRLPLAIQKIRQGLSNQSSVQ